MASLQLFLVRNKKKEQTRTAKKHTHIYRHQCFDGNEPSQLYLELLECYQTTEKETEYPSGYGGECVSSGSVRQESAALNN